MLEQENEVRPMAYIVADTETCGLGEDKVACEVALRQIHHVTLEPIREWQSLIDPQRPIQPGAMAVHGITDEMVANEPTMEEWLEHSGIVADLAGHDITLICHNVSFDLSMLLGIGSITQTICTLFWSRQLIKDSVNHKLPTLREHFDFPLNEAHRAMADVATTTRLLNELLLRSGRSLEQFAATKEQTVHTMPYGKYKGQLVMSLPGSYLQWLWALTDLEPNLRESVKKALKVQGVKVK